MDFPWRMQDSKVEMLSTGGEISVSFETKTAALKVANHFWRVPIHMLEGVN